MVVNVCAVPLIAFDVNMIYRHGAFILFVC